MVAVSGRRGLRPRGAALRMAIAAGCVLLAAACGTAAHPGPAGGVAASAAPGKITETGSSLLYPLMHSWGVAYQSQSGVSVTTVSTSSGTGISSASAGTVDLGASDAYLSSGDVVKNRTLLNIPLVISAQMVMYNLPGVSTSAHVSLNGTVLAEIYEGAIRMWNDPRIAAINPHVKLPAVKIVPVRRKDSSGDTFLFTSYLSTQNLRWNNSVGYGTIAAWPRVPGELPEKGSTGVLQACEAAPGCIAYEGISYLSKARAAGLGEAALANAAGHYMVPSAATIQASAASFVSLTPPNETISMIDGPAVGGYPIVNYEYAVVSSRQPDARTAGELRAFLRWVVTTGNGASYVDAVGFAPLPAALVALGEQQIEEIGS